VAQADTDPAATAGPQAARTGTSGTGTSSAKATGDGNGNGSSAARTPRKSSTNTQRAGATTGTAAPKVAARSTTSRPAAPSDPRAACGSRTNFSLYYCMRTQCRQARFVSHPQCKKLQESDEVP
jgi:hypothetical protein